METLDDIERKFNELKMIRIAFMGATASGKTFFRKSLLHTLIPEENNNWFSIKGEMDYSNVIHKMVTGESCGSTEPSEASGTFKEELKLAYRNIDLLDIVLFDTYGGAFSKDELSEVDIMQDLGQCNVVLNIVDAEESLITFYTDKNNQEYVEYLKKVLKDEGYKNTNKCITKYINTRNETFVKCRKNRSLITNKVKEINSSNHKDYLSQWTIMTKCDSNIIPFDSEEFKKNICELNYYNNLNFFSFAGKEYTTTKFTLIKDEKKTNKLVINETFDEQMEKENLIRRSYYKDSRNIFKKIILDYLDWLCHKLPELVDSIDRLNETIDEAHLANQRKQLNQLTVEKNSLQNKYDDLMSKHKFMGHIAFSKEKNQLSDLKEEIDKLQMNIDQFDKTNASYKALKNDIISYINRCNSILQEERIK